MYPHTNAQDYTPSIKQSQIDLIPDYALEKVHS
jgi:hypothetical protein